MCRLCELGVVTNAIFKAEDDELKALLQEMKVQNVAYLLEQIKTLEVAIDGLLTGQQTYHMSVLLDLMERGELTDETILRTFGGDAFGVQLANLVTATNTALLTELVPLLMPDKNLGVSQFSSRAVGFLDDWGPKLGNLMQTTAHDAVSNAIQDVLTSGEGVPVLERKLLDLPEFTRTRARTTAVTEMLRAYSVSEHEAYMQSPSVVGIQWVHTGARKNKPRQNHVELSGTIIDKVNGLFDVGGYPARFPRDPSLPAKESVRCHCTTIPKVDENIIQLSDLEKEVIRQNTLNEIAITG